MRKTLALVVCLLAVLLARVPAQERQTFRSGVELIQLDVSVLDGDRRPVRGLTAADFTLLEDGQPQRIVAFNAIDSKAPLSLSGVVLSASPGPFAAPRDHLAKLLPIVPTTRRDFDRTDAVHAFLRVYQGGRVPIEPVSMAISIVDAAGAALLSQEAEIEPGRFSRNRAADYQLQLPLAQLAPGEYLLTFAASIGELTGRRNVRFTVR